MNKNCCCEKLHPCCAKYEVTEKCPCNDAGDWCFPLPPEGCDGNYPEGCTSVPAIPNPLIAKWEFSNLGASPTSVPADIGTGTAVLQGSVTATFDVDSTHSRYWRTANYPEQGLDSGLSGVRFNIPTTIDENPTIGGVVFRFKLRVVPGSSAWFRVEYTVNNGTSWLVALPATKIEASFPVLSYHWTPTISTAIVNSAAINNPNFAVRVVSVFSPNAFTEYASSTSFLADEAYESCKNIQGDPTTAAYVAAAPWGFDDVELSFISVATSTVIPCGDTQFIRSESGCFATEEDCYKHFADLNPTSIEFFEDVICEGDVIPLGDPGLPAEFCVVPSRKKLCPQWMCGCCDATIACCTVIDADEECVEDIPNCTPEDCCEPPEPVYCCCVRVGADGCTVSKECRGFIPGAISGLEECSDLVIIAPDVEEYCIEVPSCDYCDPAIDCNIGIRFRCVNSCETSCFWDCSGYSGSNCPPTSCITPPYLCPTQPDPLNPDDLCCFVCPPMCGYDPPSGGLSTNQSECCTAACSDPVSFNPCNEQFFICPPPSEFCADCSYLTYNGEQTFQQSCSLCKKAVMGLCYTGNNCPPWVFNLNAMNFDDPGTGEDLTKGILFDTNQKQILSDTFFFGYGERFL